MTPLAVTLLLAWRDPARNFAFILGCLGVLIFVVAIPQLGAYWVLWVWPAFLISTALTLPTFSPFERAMPVTVQQLLWSRILSSLGPIWISLLLGVWLMLVNRQPFSRVGRPLECAAFFTICACLATLARLASSPLSERVLALGALVSAALALLTLTPTPALILANAAILPIAARYWWTYVPDLSWPRGLTLARFFWPPLRLIWSRWMFLIAAAALWFGLDFSWSLLPFTGLFLKLESLPNRYLLALPVPRRQILLALLAPIIVPFVIGVAFSGRFDDADRIVSLEHPPGQTGLRDYYGNPPGLLVPTYYYRTSATLTPPAIVAPWGETAQPVQPGVFTTAIGPRRFLYNPYWVARDNSDRFFEWQFARATREIYGMPLLPNELHSAIHAGLRPVTRQPRLLVIRAACGTAFLLVMMLLAAMSDWFPLHRVPRLVRGLLPFWLPLGVMLTLDFFFPIFGIDGGERWILQLSAALPSNLILLILMLLAPMAPIYWALETVFKQVEFPDKPKELA